MPPPVAAVIDAHGTLERLVAGLNDQQVSAATVCARRALELDHA
jgi:hypothetical protein